MTSHPTESKERRDYMPKLLVNGRKIAEEFAFLSNDDKNRELFLALTDAQSKDIGNCLSDGLPPSYKLIRVDGRIADDRFEIALIELMTGSVVYYNRVMIVGYLDLNAKPVTQCLLWRSYDFQHSKVLHGVAGDVFFNYLLEEYQVIMSDNSQTGNGQQFWLSQLSRAIYESLFVYYYDVLSCSIKRIDSAEMLADLVDTMWGEADDFSYHLAAISKIPLPVDIKVEITEGA
jgi:hypothetical protein